MKNFRSRRKKSELIKLAVTGPRPENMEGVPAAYIRSSIRDTLEVYLEEHDGYVHAYSGMARGVDTIFATQALRMGIPLIACVPFEGFDELWSPNDKRVLAELLAQAKEVHVVSDGAKINPNACYNFRNRFLVDNSNVLLAYYVPSKPANSKIYIKASGTANCIEYAKTTTTIVRETDITELFSLLK